MVRAALEVFGIPELLENILEQLDAQWDLDDVRDRQPSAELFTLQRVRKGFQATIQGSKKLKRKMFIEFDGDSAEKCRLNFKHITDFDYLRELWFEEFQPNQASHDTIAWIENELFPAAGSDSDTFLHTTIKPLGSRRHIAAARPNLPLSLPIDSVPNTFSTTRLHASNNIKPGAPSWRRMKLTSKASVINTFVKICFYHQGVPKEYTTLIVSEPQDTLGTFADRLHHLSHLDKRKLLQLYSQKCDLSTPVLGLRLKVPLPECEIDRLRHSKTKHEQGMDCGKRNGECAFCYFASGTEDVCEETQQIIAEL